MVIGSGPSGLDISFALDGVATSVTMSYHNLSAGKTFPEHVFVKPNIQRFTATGVLFDDGTEVEFSDVIFCTGKHREYEYEHHTEIIHVYILRLRPFLSVFESRLWHLGGGQFYSTPVQTLH